MRLRLANRSDWKRITDYVKGLAWRDSEGHALAYRVTIEPLRPARSVAQNARYWALLTAISQQAPEHMGGEWHDPETWHTYCARRFLGVQPGPFGEGVTKRTSKLKVGEFGDYMTAIEAWASDQFPGFDFGYEEAA